MMLKNKIEDYIQQNITSAPSYLNIIEENTKRNFANHSMMSNMVQGRLLSMISKMIRPKYVLEIGTFCGYSALCLAEGIKKGGKVISIEKNEELKKTILQNLSMSPYNKEIKIIFGDAKDILMNRKSELNINFNLKFDLAFIDANKLSYQIYYELVLDKLKSGGYIVIDNILWKGGVLENEKNKFASHIDKLNNFISKDNRVENFIVPLRDGLSIIRKI